MAADATDGDEPPARPQLVGDERPQTDRRFASTFGARIVLADDNADMRGYLASYLRRTTPSRRPRTERRHWRRSASGDRISLSVT